MEPKGKLDFSWPCQTQRPKDVVGRLMKHKCREALRILPGFSHISRSRKEL